MRSKTTPNLSLRDRLELRTSVGRMVDGLWIGASVDESKEADALRRVENALSLIKTHDPLRYGRLVRDLLRIWVRLLPNSHGSFNRAARACQLDTRFVLDQTVAVSEIACVIVHEATHARLEHHGIAYEEGSRHRIESACVREELRFARRLPDTVQRQEWLQEWLAAPPDQAFWTNRAFEKRRVDGLADALRYLGVPGWLIVVLRGVRRPIRWLRRAAREPWRSLDAGATAHELAAERRMVKWTERRDLATWLEFHDSTLAAVNYTATDIEVVLDAYVHRWETKGDSWLGSGSIAARPHSDRKCRRPTGLARPPARHRRWPFAGRQGSVTRISFGSRSTPLSRSICGFSSRTPTFSSSPAMA